MRAKVYSPENAEVLSTVIAIVLPDARAGDVNAMAEMGNCLSVLGKREAAAAWYRKAAKLGYYDV